MEIEIKETSRGFRLAGFSSTVGNNQYGAVGMQLMDAMWKSIRGNNAGTTGINHWVYLPDGNLFVGVELLENQSPPADLEELEFELPRYLKHVHVGPYQLLPSKWQTLKAEIATLGETIGPHSLEIYGHHCDDPAQLETTILIGLEPNQG